MIGQLTPILESECALDMHRPVLVGVSGGVDSLCLMDLLADAGYRLTVAHLNHSLRPEADNEAQRVKEYARKIGADFVSDKLDVFAIKTNEHLSLEEAARNARYQFLFLQARQAGAQAVAVGHTADDQVETILMHLLRGAGLSGLKGMLYRTLPTAWSREIPLVRPLLGVWRAEILEYVLGRGYEPVFDASNLDVTYFRNKLRHELIPTLESYNPLLRRNLWQMGDILREDYSFIQGHAVSAWEACLLEAGDSYLVFSRQQCLEQPKAIQRYLLKMAIETLRPGIRDLDFYTLDRAQRFLYVPTRSGKIELTNGLTLAQHGGRLTISVGGFNPVAREYPTVQPGVRLDLGLPGALELGGGWIVRSDLLSGSRELLVNIQANSDAFQAWVDADLLHSSLAVRSRLPGDRFRPLGMGGHSLKLSDFMVNVKMPKEARSGWPLFCGTCDRSEEILWVPGYRQSDHCRVTSETQRIAWLYLEKGE
jgi:tRNA(Ile)-lysidine synthase